MGQVDVQIVIQLWQVAFAAIIACGALVSLGFGAAIVFVRRGECEAHRCDEDKKYEKIMETQNEIFSLIREVKTDVDILKGKQSAVS